MSSLIAFNYTKYGDTTEPGPRGISIHDPVNGNTKALFDIEPTDGSLGAPAWAADGSGLYFSSFYYGMGSKKNGCGIYMIDLRTKKLSYLWGHKSHTVFEIRVSPDGQYFACIGTMHSRAGAIVLKKENDKLVELNLLSAKEVAYYYTPLWKDAKHLFVYFSSDSGDKGKNGYRLYNVESQKCLEENLDWVYTDSPQKKYRVGYKGGNIYNPPLITNLETNQKLNIPSTVSHPAYEPDEAPGMRLASLPSFSPDENYAVFSREFKQEGEEKSNMFIYDIEKDTETNCLFTCPETPVWCSADDAEFDFQSIKLRKVGVQSSLQRLFS